MSARTVRKHLVKPSNPLLSPIFYHESILPCFPYLQSGIPRLSTEKATNRPGWKPRFSFDKGSKRSVNWYLEPFRKNAAAYLIGHFSFVGKASELVIRGI